jgi:hypothetical protein
MTKEPMTTGIDNDIAAPEAKSKTRLYIGIIILILSLTMPIWGSAIVAAMGLPPAISTVLIGLSIAGGPDLLLVAAAAVMGKESLNYILGQIGRWFKRSFKLAENVSKRRYIFGLVLFWGSILIRWVIGFFPEIPPPAKGGTDWGLIILIAFEIVLVIGIFVLGANFWEKLGSLFRWNTQVVAIEAPAEPST